MKLSAVFSALLSLALLALAPAVTVAQPASGATTALTSGAGQESQVVMRLREAFYEDMRAHRFSDATLVGRRVLRLTPLDDRFALDFAYALLDGGQSGEATPLLTRLSASKDTDVASAAVRQLATVAPKAPDALGAAYEDEHTGDYSDSIVKLGSYLSTHPADCQARLQYAYDLTSLRRTDDARREFALVSLCADAQLASRAKAALTTFAPSSQRDSIYGFVQQEGRYADTIGAFDARHVLGNGHQSTIYAVLHLTDDSRSSFAGAGQIYNDNAASFDLGLERPLGPHVAVFAEGGYSIGLLKPRSFLEDRIGVRYFRNFGQTDGPHANTSLGASLASYSRFAGNAIGYAQAEHDVPLFGDVRGFVGINSALDAQRLAGNNFFEEAAGLQTGVAGGNLLRLEAVRGQYFFRGAAPTATTSYSTLRAVVFFRLGRH